MKYLIFLILIIIGCVTSANVSTQHSIVYVDGCYYITTTQGGITHKANCTNTYHKE